MKRRARSGTHGFTLVELIVVLVILAILAAILIPAMVGWIADAQAKTCFSNRAQIERFYLYEKTLYYNAAGDEAVTLEKVLAGDYAESRDDVLGLRCPAGGVYSVDGEHVVCSIASHNSGESASYTDDSFFPAANDAIASAVSSSSWNSGSNAYSNVESVNRDLILNAISEGMRTYLAGKSWSVQRSGSGYNLYVYSGDVAALSAGAAITVRKYSSLSPDAYTEGTGYVGTNSAGALLVPTAIY